METLKGGSTCRPEFTGRSELHRSPQIGTDTTDHTDPNHRYHRSFGNGTDPSKFFKSAPGLPENHSYVPLASLGTRQEAFYKMTSEQNGYPRPLFISPAATPAPGSVPTTPAPGSIPAMQHRHGG